MMRSTLWGTASLLVLMAATPALAQPAASDQPAPVSALIDRVDIPYQRFTLPNGLRVLVHTDRKAPVVAVSTWYHVGSKDEPKGKTGFAHLFEHLMFNGSENAPNDFFEPLQQVGATDYNGTTWFDRTNYFETVPVAALERTLFLESDRMGHLLGGITQAKLDNQRGVVQNEKRQGDNAPFGTVDYLVYATLFPDGHPYRHSTIGSMADLNGASLEDVKGWFRANYGPNNAVLVLAGDIDAATARPLVEKWFGAIPAGPAVTRVAAPVPALPAPVTKVMKDAVANTRVMRLWAVEGVNGRDTTALDAAAAILGGLSSSRLDNALVRGEQSALNVSANIEAFENVGVLTVSADVKPGQDAARVAARMDAVVADFLRTGPTADELRRVQTKTAATTIAGYESVGGFGGKAVALAEGEVYSGDPTKYKRDLRALAALTPAQVASAARKWLGRPVFALTVEPGVRDTSPAMLEITGGASAAPTPPAGRVMAWYAKPGTPRADAVHAAAERRMPVVVAAVGDPDRKTFPALGAFPPLKLPAIERTTLANGIPVYFAQRHDVPTVRVAVSFDAGVAADPADRYGVQKLTLDMMRNGTTRLGSRELAEAQERLGATIAASSSLDRSDVTMLAVSPNLGASLGLLADVVRNPAFAPAELERLRGLAFGTLASTLSDPNGIARLLLPEKVYGSAYPYGRPASGIGTAVSLRAITRDDLVRFHQGWLRPDNAAIFVVGDTTLAALKPMLDRSFGDWRAPASPRLVKAFTASVPPRAGNRIYLVDKPGAPQSVIRAGQVLDASGKDAALLVLRQSNDVLGGSFLSRLNTDLRETKGWSYGVGSGVPEVENRPLYLVNAPVQTDRTGEAIAALIADMREFATTKGVTADELTRTTNGSIRELPGAFESSEAMLGAMQAIVHYGRPDDYYQTLGARFQAMTVADLDRAARAAIDPAKLVFIVVGDAAKVRPQLAKLGLPVEELPLAK